MAWETDQYGRARYVQKLRINGRVTSRVLGTGEAGLGAESEVFLQRKATCQRQAHDKEIQTKLDLYERAVNQLVEQTFINQGFIKRKSVWQRVSRLNIPLTPDEKAHIKHIKSISERC